MASVAVFASSNRVVFDGQSLNIAGFGGQWISQVMTGLGPYSNPSIGSTPWTDLITRAPQSVYPLAAKAQNAILVMGIGGESSLFTEHKTGAQIYAQLVAYSAAAKAQGFDKVLGLTVPPSTSITGSDETARTTLNGLILADASHAFDATVDISVSPLNDPTNTTYFNADGLHLKTAGSTVVSGLVGPTLRGLMI